MKFISTRSPDTVCIEQAIMSGTAPDGGLYVPEVLPDFTIGDFDGIDSFSQIATRFLAPFFAGSTLAARLSGICDAALNFPIPLNRLPDEANELSVLELFHGPTAAFKDVGARFLASTMVSILDQGEYAQPPVTVIVATSGDTGGAVAAAVHRTPGPRVIVRFPDGRVSPRQQHQLTCWGDNIVSLSVRGEFDDCQRLAKEVFASSELNAQHNLVSANSINVGRLLPQAANYAKCSLEQYRATGKASNFIIPTGNLGNGFACVWARRMGLPIDRIIFATNANTTIPDFLQSGEWQPRSSRATLASAMDVGDPSNMERLRALCGDVDEVRKSVSAISVSDDIIRETISDEFRRHGIAWCPHTATGLHVYRELPDRDKIGQHWVVVATAHAAKFDTIVEPLVGTSIEPPPELAALLDWPAEYETIDAELVQVAQWL